jgi:hypothetical protein
MQESQISKQVFVFKVTLAGRKTIWRRIAMRGNQTLDDLHEVIYDAFDRDDEHLYSFYFPKPGMKRRDITRNAVEYAHPYTAKESGPFGESPNNAAKAKLDALKLKPKQVFFYLFDFGDEWWHEITVEQIDAPAEKGKYPKILEKHGKSPPQYPDWDDEDGDDEDEE